MSDKKPIFLKFTGLLSFLSKVQAQAGSLLNAVATLIGATEAEEREKALEALRGIIVQQHSDFDNNDMHDAQEFLTVLLQNLAVSFFRLEIICDGDTGVFGVTRTNTYQTFSA